MTPSETTHFRTVVVPAVAKIPSMEVGLEYLGRLVDKLGKEVLKLRAEVDALKKLGSSQGQKSKKEDKD